MNEIIVYNIFVFVPRIKNGAVWSGGYTDINLASKSIYNFAKKFNACDHLEENTSFFHRIAGEGEKVTVNDCLKILYDIKDQFITGEKYLHFFSEDDYARILIRKEIRCGVYHDGAGKNHGRILYLGVNQPITLNEYPGEKF